MEEGMGVVETAEDSAVAVTAVATEVEETVWTRRRR